MSGRGRSIASGLGVLAMLVVVAALLRLLVYRAPGGGLEWGWPADAVARFRWTPIAIALIAGTALAVSGVLLQALLRNPLASPYILGLSSGAGLGVMIAIYLAHRSGAPTTGTHAPAALAGAMVTLAVVYGLGHRRGGLDPLSLVLVGVVISALCGSMIMFLQHLVPQGLRGDLVTWMTGHIRQGTPRGPVVLGGLVVAAASVAAAGFGRAMDAATLGADEARSVGVSMGRLRAALFVLAGVLAATAVALAGPIAFVGLVAPHAARLLLGPGHRTLVLGAALAGAFLVLAADVAAQVIAVQGGRMPAGVFTALVGGPAFIWLLRTGRGQS